MTSTQAFGPRLRASRLARGLSLSEFARRLYYSKGHVSRIETGFQAPSMEFVRRCDAELEANGELVAMMAGAAPSASPSPADPDDEGVWIMAMAPDGSSSFTPLGRRDVLLGGAAILAGLGTTAAFPTAASASVSVDGGEQLQHHRRLLEAARGLGQVAPPGAVLPMLVGQLQALRTLTKETQGRDFTDVATLSARTAEFAGWMAQEAGDVGSAGWWSGKAARVATAAGDHHTASYALVRRALITMYQGDAAETVALARQAQKPGTPPRIRGLAAQREAQGHALAGNHDECMRALDVAAAHLAAARTQVADEPVIGTSHIADPVAIVTGWCLYDLGRPKEAAAVLDREIQRIPPTAVRARTRFGVRQALAHAAANELDRACELTRATLGQATAVGSATILQDVRRLATTLRRWHTHPAVRALEPAFATTFYRGA
jgi:hypothetical protein